MQDTRKRFGCPKCQKAVKVPLEHLGKRVACPKCSFVFRAGPKLKPEPEIVADLDDALAPELPVAGWENEMSPLAAAPPMASPTPLPPSQPANSYQSQMARRPKSQSEEMTEFETHL